LLRLSCKKHDKHNLNLYRKTMFSQSVYDFMHTYTPFKIFGTSHWAAMLVSLIIIIIVPLFAKKYLSLRNQQRLGTWIGIVVMASYFAWISLICLSGEFDIRVNLPLQLCQFTDLLVIFVMVWRNKNVFDVVYFWGLSGLIQGTITPDLPADYPHFLYFRYWLGHPGVVLCVIYACVVYQMRPTWASLWKAFWALMAFFAFTALVNTLLDANYFWICSKPTTKSLLDYLGPWPWYILGGIGVALVHFFVAYLPFWIRDKFT
jgi:hypothetical integral membrane protein (TIGR02206 family)